MNDVLDTGKLIRDTRSGDEEAKIRFYSLLAVRFLPVVKCELERHVILKDACIDTDEKGREICLAAIEEIKKISPVDSTRWSLKRAVHILHNITDDFIVNTLVPMAKNNHIEAENLLFILIRNKLLQWIERKRWKTSG